MTLSVQCAVSSYMLVNVYLSSRYSLDHCEMNSQKVDSSLTIDMM